MSNEFQTDNQVASVKSFTVISQGNPPTTTGSVFWVIFWAVLFFPALIVVIPWYMMLRKGDVYTIEAVHHNGSTLVHEQVTKEQLDKLYASCDLNK